MLKEGVGHFSLQSASVADAVATGEGEGASGLSYLRPHGARRCLLAASALSLLVLTTVPAVARGQTSRGTSIVLQGHCGGEPSIGAAASGLVVVAGRGDSCSSAVGPVEVWVSRDGGRSFGPRQAVGPAVAGNYDSDVTIDRSTGVSYVVSGGGSAVALCQSSDLGRSWQVAPQGVLPCTSPTGLAGAQALLVDRPWVLADGGQVLVGWSTPLPLQSPAMLPKVAQTTTWGRYVGGRPTPLPPTSTAGGDLAQDSIRSFSSRPALGRHGTLHQLLSTGSVAAPTLLCQVWSVSLDPGASRWRGSLLFDGCSRGISLDRQQDSFPTVTADATGHVAALVVGDLAGGSASRPYLATSRDNGLTWSALRPLPGTSGAYSRPAATMRPGGDVVVGWYHAPMRSALDPAATWRYEIVDLAASGRGAHLLAATGPAPVHRGALPCLGCQPNDLSSITVGMDGRLLAAFEDDRGVRTGNLPDATTSSDAVLITAVK